MDTIGYSGRHALKKAPTRWLPALAVAALAVAALAVAAQAVIALAVAALAAIVAAWNWLALLALRIDLACIVGADGIGLGHRLVGLAGLAG